MFALIGGQQYLAREPTVVTGLDCAGKLTRWQAGKYCQMRITGNANDRDAPQTCTADEQNQAQQPQPRCFVIQPFDRGKFDKRYDDAFEPALRHAGFAAYRVDQDPGTDVLIAAIEEGIRNSAICLADVTTNNPNVWYELGFAYAAGKPVILTCCDEREGALPFDIHHRHVIRYQSESASDFDNLKRQVTERATVLLDRVAEKQMEDSDPIAPLDGLPQRETHLLGLTAAETATTDARESVWKLRNTAESGGMTSVAFGLALRGLIRRGFIKTEQVEDYDGEYIGAYVTDEGWCWIEEHDHLFNLELRSQSALQNDLDDDIPF